MDPRGSPPPPQSFPPPSQGFPPPSQSFPPTPRAFDYAAAGYPFSPVNYGGVSEPLPKKKRGRPRKFSPDCGGAGDGGTSLALSTSPPTGGTPTSETPAKRRGRPPGSRKKQLDAMGSFGVGFTPHVIMVYSGEDIASKILTFSQQGPRIVCVLSANGAVSHVTLRQPSVSGGTMTYEGRYEIISLSGSYLLSESDGSRSRTGGLSVSFAGSDGHVLGGGVAGVLKAAAPVQVIVGSFITDGKKPKTGPSSPSPANMRNFGAPVVAASPTSQVHSSESEEVNGNGNFNQGPVFYNNNNAPQAFHGMPMHPSMVWPNPTAQMFPQ